PSGAAGWLGKGEAARALHDFEGAAAAYAKVLGLAPGHADALRGLAAAARREPLALAASAAVGAPSPELTEGPLAPPPTQAQPCDAAAHATPRSEAACRSLEELGRATTPPARDEAARHAVDAYRDLRPDCASGAAVCGPHVARALLAAARAFVAAGEPAKGIATAKMLLDPSARGLATAGLAPEAELFVADAYHALGIYDEAGQWYGRHAKEAPQAATAAPAGARALAIRLALGQGDAASSGASPPAPDTGGRSPGLALARGLRLVLADPRWTQPAQGSE
ncbi:MAG: hypothetical protein HY908_10840, partial [Myxococcales bacterium]|nr:hypothetical protein [Myxococcales bacterium]